MRGEVLRLAVRYALLAVAVVLLNFFLPRLLPGDPLSFASGEGLDLAVPLSAAAREQLRAYYHLDQSTAGQLLAYLGDLAHGDLGWSISRPAPVAELILARLPWTLALLVTALAISAVAGTALGFVAGWRQGSATGGALLSAAAVLAAVPEFLTAIALLLIFSVGLGWFPLTGARSSFAEYSGQAVTLRRVLDVVWHLSLPAATLVLSGAAGFMLIARDAAAGLRGEPWLLVARAKGLTERRVALHHALPNAAMPLLAFLGLRVGAVLGGALVVERVFNVPGVGLLAYQAVQARDYPVLQSVFLLSSLGVLAANLGVDLAYLRLRSRRGAVVD